MKGAFTGALESRKGKLELAGNGSILLDEVSEIPLELQAKLLRVLEDRTFTRVGGTAEVRAEGRVIAATNRDLFSEVSRKDLTAAGVRTGAFLLGGDARLSFDYAHLAEDRRGGDNLDQPEFMAEVAESIDSTRDTASFSWVHTPSSRAPPSAARR